MSSAICFTRPLRWKTVPRAWRHSSKSASRGTRTAKAFSSEVDSGSRQENASNQNLEPRFDSIETEKALGHECCADQRTIKTFGKCCGMLETKPRQTGLIRRIRRSRQSPPQQSDQVPRGTLRVLQDLQG